MKRYFINLLLPIKRYFITDQTATYYRSNATLLPIKRYFIKVIHIINSLLSISYKPNFSLTSVIQEICLNTQTLVSRVIACVRARGRSV